MEDYSAKAARRNNFFRVDHAVDRLRTDGIASEAFLLFVRRSVPRNEQPHVALCRRIVGNAADDVGGADRQSPALDSLPGAAASIYLDFNGDGSNQAFNRDGMRPTSAMASRRTFGRSGASWRRSRAVQYQRHDGCAAGAADACGHHAELPWRGRGVRRDVSDAGRRSVDQRLDERLRDRHGRCARGGSHDGAGTSEPVQRAGQKVAEYRPGNGSTTPIMGNATGSGRAIWEYGTSSVGPHSYQDDMAIIAGSHHGYTFGYRPDDHGGSIASADALKVSGRTATQSGVIEKTTDEDYFSFTTNAGTVSFTGSPASVGAMLHMKLKLLNTNGKVLKTVDSTSLKPTLTMKLAAGRYYLVVASHGSYGDVGQYSVRGTIV